MYNTDTHAEGHAPRCFHYYSNFLFVAWLKVKFVYLIHCILQHSYIITCENTIYENISLHCKSKLGTKNLVMQVASQT